MNYEERLAKAEEILGKAEKRLEVADVWSVSEAVDMLVGMRPIVGEPGTDPDRIKRDMRELAYGSIDAKTLPCVGKPKQRRVRPADFIRWATSKGLPIPQRMEALLGEGPARPVGRAVDPAPPTELQLNDAPSDEAPDNNPRPRRTVAWIAELIRLWPEIAKAYSKPNALQVMEWLKQNGDASVFPKHQKDQPDKYSLRWIDADGHPQTVGKKRVENVLSESPELRKSLRPGK